MGTEALNIFDAEVILPVQYFGMLTGGSKLCSEQKLMLAVLVDAVNVIQSFKRSGTARKRRAYSEALRWVETSGNSEILSFESICEALDVEFGFLRQRIVALTHGYGDGPIRVRLKATNRAQHMTENRVRSTRRAYHRHAS
jgi:hypothetical protein